MRVPSLAEIIQAGIDAAQARMHVSIPGIVEKYDPATQTADVKPAIKTPVFDPETGERDGFSDPPVIPNVPVMFPRGGGYCVVFPLTAGDEVTLVFSELNTSEFRLSGSVSEPLDTRRHGIGAPVAIPGVLSDAKPLSDAGPAGSAMVLGKDGAEGQIRVTASEIKLGATAAQFVARADKVLSAVNAVVTSLNTFVATFNAHTHLSTVVGTPTSVPTASTPPTAAVPATPATDVASTLVKAT